MYPLIVHYPCVLQQASKTAEEKKKLGNEYFQNNQFDKSIELYTEACRAE